jgi:hypothetical protein
MLSKHIKSFSRILFGLLIIAPFVSHAVNINPSDITYHLLAPLPFIAPSGSDKTSVAAYIPNMMKLIIALAGIAAVMQIIFGGFEYITSGGFGQTVKAKERITNALLGLLLAIGAYSILYTINPLLVNLNLSLETLPPPVITTTSGNGVTRPPLPATGSTWQSDGVERKILGDGGIGLNNNTCTQIGQSNCTSVFGIGSTVIGGLISLKEACNCTVVITGGTEYWLHSEATAHRPGGNVVDLRLDSGLLNFLKTNGQPTSAAGCSVGEAYSYNGAVYVNEVIAGNAPHFHVCF